MYIMLWHILTPKANYGRVEDEAIKNLIFCV